MTGEVTHRRLLVAYGTRPEIIKLAPVVRALRDGGQHVRCVDTGQHASAEMNAAIADELGLVADVRRQLPPEPTARLGALIGAAQRELAEAPPDLVLCLGDTETVPAFALASRRAGVAFWHLEAGLRSFNERSVEELNRRFATAAASLNLAPTERARQFLAAEGVDERRIAVVGNPVIDVLVEHKLEKVPIADRRGVLFTAHRAGNVDDPVRLGRVVSLANELAAALGEVVFPVHPRTAVMLERSGLSASFNEAVVCCAPLGYRDFLEVLRRSRVIVTDSGGVQEEAAYFGVPVVVLRGSTPRWEGVENGSALLASLHSDDSAAEVLGFVRAFAAPGEQRRIDALECPYGDGTTAGRVAELVASPACDDLARLAEPTFSGSERPF